MSPGITTRENKSECRYTFKYISREKSQENENLRGKSKVKSVRKYRAKFARAQKFSKAFRIVVFNFVTKHRCTLKEYTKRIFDIDLAMDFAAFFIAIITKNFNFYRLFGDSCDWHFEKMILRRNYLKQH